MRILLSSGPESWVYSLLMSLLVFLKPDKKSQQCIQSSHLLPIPYHPPPPSSFQTFLPNLQRIKRILPTHRQPNPTAPHKKVPFAPPLYCPIPFPHKRKRQPSNHPPCPALPSRSRFLLTSIPPLPLRLRLSASPPLRLSTSPPLHSSFFVLRSSF